GPPQLSHLPLESLCIPVLLWIAFRLGPREATTATLALSLLAVRGTVEGLGPFARASQNQALLLLQTYMGVVTLTIAVVGALVAEQRRNQERHRRFHAELEARVTERTGQLADSQARLLEAQRVAHIGSWEWQVNSDRLWWSEELFRIFGLNPDQSAPDYA